MNTIALCIPAYNAAWCLPRLLESAGNQLIPFDEILVYDDCSIDLTVETALSYGAKVVNGDINRGCSYGKNKLLETTNCKWVHFHDADDELLPNFTTLAHQWINKDNCQDVVLFDFEYRDNETHQLISKSDFDSDQLKQDPVKYAILNQINPFCGLYKVAELKKIGGYDIDAKIIYNEDVAFHCKLAIAGLTFGVEKEISIINYHIKNSMSDGNKVKCAQAHFEVMKINAEKVGKVYNNEIAQKLWANAIILASLSDWQTSKKAVDLALKLDPKITRNESSVVKLLSFFNAYFAIRARELMIRIFKNKLRTSA
ncbi:glycosyltransferase family 2 protein [Pedobacter polaris]|uniref:glycosyltransferase family 2 protein n=1 Tax=Pedobacter polaris TaxID=2571273 RepID=UPI00145E403D|nr:glycosyltransferase [Pedobacter polaris]